jgi:hypothetical protein
MEFPPSPSSPSRSSATLTSTTTTSTANNVPTVTPIIRKKHPPTASLVGRDDVIERTELKRMKLNLNNVAAFDLVGLDNKDDVATATSPSPSSIKKKYYISVRGKGTYRKKEELHQFGGFWDPKSKSWEFYCRKDNRDGDFQLLDRILRFADTITTIPYEYKSLLEEHYSQSYLNHLYMVSRLVIDERGTTNTFYAIYKNYYGHDIDHVFEQIDLDDIIFNKCDGIWNNELKKYEFIRNQDADQCIHLLLCYRRFITVVVPANFQLSTTTRSINDSQQKQTQKQQTKLSEYELQNYINKGIIMVEEEENKRYGDYNPPPSSADCSSNTNKPISSQRKVEEGNNSVLVEEIINNINKSKEVFSVGGNTFHHKEKLKEFGGRWQRKLKKWIFFDDDKHKSEIEQSYPDLEIEILTCEKLNEYKNKK